MPPPQHFVVDQNWPFGTKISHLGPKKPPGTVKSLKWPFWSFSAPGGHWEKRKQIYIMTLVQLFSIYMTSIHPRHLPDTLRHHPDTTQTPPDTIQTPQDNACFMSFFLSKKQSFRATRPDFLELIFQLILVKYEFGTPEKYSEDLENFFGYPAMVIFLPYLSIF